MYVEREHARHSNAEPSPSDWLKGLAYIVMVASIMALVLSGLKNRAESASKAEQRVMTEEVIIP